MFCYIFLSLTLFPSLHPRIAPPPKPLTIIGRKVNHYGRKGQPLLAKALTFLSIVPFCPMKWGFLLHRVDAGDASPPPFSQETGRRLRV
jgi:hypothetical protein